MGCKPPTQDTHGDHDASAHLPGWPHAVSRAETRREERARARASALETISIQWADALKPFKFIELGPRCRGVWAPAERRWDARVEGLVLEDHHRGKAASLRLAALCCGSSYVALRTWEDGPAGGVDVRMVVRTHCGTRACERCSEAIRRRCASRAEGPHNTFLTCTVPPCLGSKDQMWEGIGAARKVLFREMRREFYLANRKVRTKLEPQQSQMIARRELARSRISAQAKLEYAWCVEPHESGYPHLHLVINWMWVDYAWFRATWSAALGAIDAHVDARRVYHPDGICRYLSKYISKSVLTLDILGIMKRKRLWGTTKRLGAVPDAKWFVEEEYHERDLSHQVNARETWGINEGWSYQHGRDGIYARWTRTCAEKTSPTRELSMDEIVMMPHEGSWEDEEAPALEERLELDHVVDEWGGKLRDLLDSIDAMWRDP